MCLAVASRSHLATALGFGRAPNAEGSQTGLIGMWFTSKELTDWRMRQDLTLCGSSVVMLQHLLTSLEEFNCLPGINRVICLTMPLHLLRMTPTESRAPEPVMVNPLGRTGRKDEISFHEELSEEQLVTIHTPGKPPELKGTIASYRRSEVQLLVWCLRMILGERSKPSIYLLSSSLKLRDLKKEQSIHNGI
ncbi:hypothetical protein CapIbe_022504 [Capra ibex]